MATSDGYSAIKADRIVDGALSLLVRASVLGNTVFREGLGNFRGAKNDTITLRLPAYAKPGKRTLRGSTPRTRKKLHERAVTVQLTHGYTLDVPLTDEEITLDIERLATEVIAPSVQGIAREYETDIASLMENASYAASTITIDPDDPFAGIVAARKTLSDHQVPTTERFLAVGSSVAAAILESPQLRRVDQSGTDAALRRAEIGMIAGFTVIESQALSPDFAVAYHRSAFAVASMAPIVPDGVAWGASESADGYAVRVMQALDAGDLDGPTNVVFHDAWVGMTAVTDAGTIDPVTGKFEPAEDPDESGVQNLLVRAVELELGS